MALIIVTTGNDTVAEDGQTSLREALTIAQSTGGSDTIVFASGVSTVELGAGGPLTIATGESVRIVGDRNGDGVADVTIDGNNTTSHFVVQAGATATFTSLNFVAGHGVGAPGYDGGQGSYGSYGGYGGGQGGTGFTGYTGGPGGAAAGSIRNYGTTTLVRSQFVDNDATGGFGGTGGTGGTGASGGVGQYGGNGYSGGDGGRGGDGGFGGTGGTGGYAAGAIFNGAGATLNLVDTSIGAVINGASATSTLTGNDAGGGFGGTGGDGGQGGFGGNGGDGRDAEFFPGYTDYYGNYHYGVYGPVGNGGNGGDGGNGGQGGDGGNGGGAAGAILNLGIINSTTTQSVAGNSATPGHYGYAGGGGGGGGGGIGGTGGTGGFPGGYMGMDGGGGGGGGPGSIGFGGVADDGILDQGGAFSSVVTADVVYYIYSPTTQVLEGSGGTTTITFHVNRQGSDSENQTVFWEVNAASAGISGADFASGAFASGSFNFTAAQNSMMAQIVVDSDWLAEFNETFEIRLVSVTDGGGGLSHALGTSSTFVTVVDDDPLVSLYSNPSLASLVQGFQGANAFAAALAAASAGQAIDVEADGLLGNVGAQNVSANNLTIVADAPFNAALSMIGSAFTLRLGGNANISVAGNAAGGNDITGNAGANLLQGQGFGDVLAGGLGADTMTGGAGGDRFDFNSVAEIGFSAATRDVVTDFQQGVDLIDLGDIDALTTLAGLQNFNWIGTQAHTGAGATLRYQHVSGNTLVYGDVNADGAGDFALQINGIHNLTASDFTDASIISVSGTGGADLLLGSPGAENMFGLGGNDTMRGGLGVEFYTGGAGADRYDFNSTAEIGLGSTTRDVLVDFEAGTDKIDLEDIDALTTQAGLQHFRFVGQLAHTGTGATLRFAHDFGWTILSGDVNGDGAADFELQMLGTHWLNASDFTNASVSIIQGGADGDFLLSGPGGKLLLGLGGNDVIAGHEDSDTIRGGAGFDSMNGGLGADRFDFNAVSEIGNAFNSRDVIGDFQQGIDKIDLDDIDALTTLAGVQHFTFVGAGAHTGAGATLRYTHSGGNTLLYGDVNADGAGDFTLQINGVHFLTAADFTTASISAVRGTNGNDNLAGGPGSKLILGLDGGDSIVGGAGNDTIVGGAGADTMTGGLGGDHFRWENPAHTGLVAAARDIVTDFQLGIDKINLNAIDANSTVAGNQDFTFLGTAAHTGAGATLRFQHTGGNTLVYGDINADGVGDFAIQLTGIINLTAADFIL